MPPAQTVTETETTPRPRRSAREKKQSQPYVLGSSTTTNKRKRQNADDDEVPSEHESELEMREDSAEDEYVAPRKTKGGPKGKGKARAPPALKKPRAAKAMVKSGTRRGKKKVDGDAFDAAKLTTETKIANDNALFNAIMNPAAALQATVEDYLDSLSQSPDAALADLVNCVLRACGSNDTVDSDRAVDYDGVVDALDDFTEALKEDNSPTYPLTSKLPMYKKFRKSLSEFLHRLVASSAELGSLYSSGLLPTLQTWVVAMSSSQLRSFRHTATVIALELETALCDVASAVQKEDEVIVRQREGERKRKGKGSAGRDKEFEAKAADVKERKTKVSEFLKDYFDGVFVHRYRDLDPNIRAECVHAMGNWFKKYPKQFLEGQYLRYVGWVLSDANTHVRLEAVKALVSLYAKEEHLANLHIFTERFKPRLIEMATGDTDLSVRVAVIQVLGSIDGYGLLEEEQQEKLCLLVFDEEAKVRKAVSNFVMGVWEETVETRLVGKKAGRQEKQRAGVKVLSILLVKWSKALDQANADLVEDGTGDGEISNSQDTASAATRVASIVNPNQKGRIALAVEALWDDVESVSDWEALLDVLLLDHSARADPGGESTAVSSRRKQKKVVNDPVVDDAWRLEEVEEAILLEVLVAALRKSKLEAAGAKKGEEDNAVSEISRALIKGLPSLFAKHQTDESRIADVLLIPELMNLEMFLEMRMITAYEALWDDVIKQFMTHSSPIVLSHAMSTIRYLMNATSLSNTNSAKILELEDELSSSLRDAVGGRDELEVATFSEDEARTLGAICARLATLAGTRDMTMWMEEDEGGKQSSAWDIVCALAERGRLGYREEELMVDRALHLLTLHVIWKARAILNVADAATDKEKFLEVLREQRDLLLEKLIEYSVGTQSNTIGGVKRAAFHNLMTLHVLFCPSATRNQEGDDLPLAPLALTMDDEVQYRCAGFVQAEIERYAEELEGDRPPREGHDNSQDGSDSEPEDIAETPKAKRKKEAQKGQGKTSGKGDEHRLTSRSKLEQEYDFNITMSTFLRAIRAGAVDVRHGAVLLTHCGRLGSAFELSARLMVDMLREEGMYRDNGALVSAVITRALQDSFTLFLDRVVDSDAHTLALAKLLSPCLVVRGAQLAVVKRLDSAHVVEIHVKSLTWIAKRIAAYEANGNKKSRTSAVLFFRSLLPLLTMVQSRDALIIKAQLEQALAQHKIEASATSKGWEPYRAYEKRLTTAVSKERGGKKSGKTTQNAEAVTTDDEEENEVQGMVNAANGFSSQLNQSQPKPRPAYHRQASELGLSEAESSLIEEAHDDQMPSPRSPEDAMLATPRKSIAQGSPTKSTSFRDSASLSQSKSRKRTREEPETEKDDGFGFLGVERDDVEAGEVPTQSSEIIVRRKRVRH